MYHARAGGGAFVEDEPLRVAQGSRPRPTGLSGIPASYRMAFSSRRKGGGGLGETRTMGSIACEMVLVARGVLQISVFTGAHVWDVAAGMVLVREAGGEVLGWSRGEWKPFRRFEAPRARGEESPAQSLRRWRVPLLVGGPEMVGHVASQIRPRGRSLRSVLRRFISSRGGRTTRGAS